MEKTLCVFCQKPTGLNCSHCHCSVCKYCAQFVDEDSFAFLPSQQAEEKTYCNPCFENSVATELAAYNETLERAKEVFVFLKNQSKETRLLKRKEKPVSVSNCSDHDETILRLAFLAAQANYNAIVDVNLSSEKIKNGSYQTTRWSGTAIPVQIDPSRLGDDRPELKNPN